MCGRFSLSAASAAVCELAGIPGPLQLAPRYNISPGQPVLAVRLRSVRGDREPVLLHWGLVPSWAREPDFGSRLINARAETLSEKPSFRNAFRHGRCIVPADGFYEWRPSAAGKQPYHIRRSDGGLFGLAGLWEHWMGPHGEELESLALITCAANSFMAPIHARMPVVLPEAGFSAWLDRGEHPSPKLSALLEPREWEGFEARPVSTYVNSPANEGRRCIAPLNDDGESAIDSGLLF